MKKLLPGVKFYTLVFGAIAMILRLLVLVAGTDDKGLYPAHHPAWIALCILSAAVLLFFRLLSRTVDAKRSYRENFPPKRLGAYSYLALAAGFGIVAIVGWKAELGALQGILGLASCVLLALGGWIRLQNKRPAFYVHMLPCLFLAVRMFVLGRALGAEPELQRSLFPFLATAACLIAGYQLWGFDVGLGDRRSSCFWSLSAAFLCMAAVPGSETGWLYLLLAVWLLGNLCDLGPKKARRKLRPAAVAAPATVHAPIVPRASQDPEEMDLDQLLAWAKEDLDE